MSSLGGLQKRMPLLGALFALGAASIACLPPFNGFAGEFVLSMSLVKSLYLPGMEEKIAMLVVLTGLMLVSGISAFVTVGSGAAWGGIAVLAALFLFTSYQKCGAHARTPAEQTPHRSFFRSDRTSSVQALNNHDSSRHATVRQHFPSR